MRNLFKAMAYGCVAVAFLGLNSCEDDQKTAMQEEKLTSYSGAAWTDTTLVNDIRELDTELRACFVNGKKWTYASGKNYISYKFLGNPTELQKKMFRTYLYEWMSYANLNFKEVTGNAEVRVKFADGVTDRDGNWSYIGTDARNITNQSEPTIHFQVLNASTPQSTWSRKLLHEMGHMLGLYHEHQSPNCVNQFIPSEVYAWGANSQGWSKAKVDANILNRISASLVDASSYDTKSIMLYSLPSYCYVSGVAPVEAYVLSDKDKQMITNKYPFNGKKRLYRCYLDIVNGQVVNRHFYTTEFAELYAATNVKYVESSMGLIFDVNNQPSGTKPLYRFWNQALNDHFYTANYDEYRNLVNNPNYGYTYVGKVGHVYTTSKSNTNPVYRYYNPSTGEHFYTINEAERSVLGGFGFTYEGIAYYTIKD